MRLVIAAQGDTDYAILGDRIACTYVHALTINLLPGQGSLLGQRGTGGTGGTCCCRADLQIASGIHG